MLDTNYVFQDFSISDLVALDLSPYQVALEEGQIHRCQWLDTFDQALFSGQQLLWRQGKKLLLYSWRQSLIEQDDCPESWSFTDQLNAGPVQQALSTVSKLRACLPVCELNMKILQLSVLDDEEKTVLRLQGVQFYSADNEQPVLLLLRLAGLRGYGKAFHKVAKILDHAGDNGLAFAVATERLCPGLPSYSNKPTLSFSREAPSFAVECQLIAAYLDIARRNEAGVCADLDTEFLHDYRISLRKVRSLLSLFKGVFSEQVNAELKANVAGMMKVTNRLRDLDVYLLEKQKYLTQVPESLQAGLEVLFREFQQQRNKERIKVKRFFKSQKYRQGMNALQQLFPLPDTASASGTVNTAIEKGSNAEKPVLAFASALIWKRFRKACKIARTIDDNTEDEEIHNLRIQFKKMRYLMEFFADLYPGSEFRKLLKSMRRLQTSLGNFNDCSVQQIALNEHVAAHSKKSRLPDLEMVKSVGALVAAIHKKQIAEQQKIVLSLGGFISEETQATFASLFHHPGSSVRNKQFSQK